MNDPIKVPPAVLLSRIARLESLVSSLQKEVTSQRAVIDDLGKALKIRTEHIMDNAAFVRKHLKRIDNELSLLDYKLLPVQEKLFPGHARTQVQIEKVLKGKRRPDGKNRT